MTDRLSGSQLALWVGAGVVLLLLGVRVAGVGGGESESGTGAPLRVKAAGGAGESGLIVHVAGEVERPGVYEMPAGSRVGDAVREAGGATARGFADAINLAATLADGQQIVVPARAAEGVGPATAGGAAAGPVSLGTATQADLEALDGIGPVTAADILEFRDAHGGISAIEDLDQVPGIGPATVEALRGSLQP